MTTPLLINWLIPEPFPGAGGDTGIFRAIRDLAQFGHECRVYVVPYNLMADYSTEQIRAYVRKHFGVTPAQYHRWSGAGAEADCTFATFWPTAQHVLALSNGGRRYYLVQDFEPSFYPLDTPEDNYHREKAEETYRAGLHCITLGPWLGRLLRREYQATTNHFDFAVDTATYWPRRGLRRASRRLCFYARPKTPRRAYEMGVEALQLVKARLPEVEIVLFGAREFKPEPPFPFVHAGMLTPEELATLFSSSDAGVVLSLTNPSFVSLEMMACRCAVIEIASERLDGVLTHGLDAWLVEPNAGSLADGILELIGNGALRETIAEHAYRRTQTMDWRNSARQIEAVLLRHAPSEAERCLTRQGRAVEQIVLPQTLSHLPSRNFQPILVGLGAWTGHVDFAYDLVAESKPPLIVELGTDRGESYFCFCQSVVENNTRSVCFAIDNWRGDAHGGGYDETTYRQVCLHNRRHYESFSTLVRSDFNEAIGRFADGSIDLLHLDGLHTERAVREDTELWLPKLRPGGLLLLHDVAVRNRGFGVWKVWGELCGCGRSYTFSVGPGLGLWEKPPRVPQAPLVESFLEGSDSLPLLEYYRDRTAGIQRQIAQQWSDGSICHSEFAQQTVVQVFFSPDGTHREEDSVLARIGHDEWKELMFSLPRDGYRAVRIDFVSALTIIDIAVIECHGTGATYFSAPAAAAWTAIELAGDAERQAHASWLRIRITGPDPQLYLPALTLRDEAKQLTVSMRLRVSPGEAPDD